MIVITQTYVQNIEFYEDAGPIYIFVNDPDVYTTEYLTSGLMYDIANRTRAALVTANNRFFRNNVPTQYVPCRYSLSPVAPILTRHHLRSCTGMPVSRTCST